MPQSSPPKRKHNNATNEHLHKHDRIDSLLQEHLKYFPSKTDLSTEEIANWHKDLAPFSLAAIEFAFDVHRKNAMWFPIFGNILDLCVSYDPPRVPQTTCDAICKARHGKGYSETDIKYLWEIYSKKKGTLPNRPMTDVEIDSLLGELDRKRGYAPEWR